MSIPLLDAVLLGAMVLSFALFVTVHLALFVGLLARRPRWRAPLALVLPPLAPVYGARERMWARTVLWSVAVVVYVAARVTALAAG